MNFDQEDSDPDDLRPSHVQATTAFGDQNSQTPEEGKTETAGAAVSWNREGNSDRRAERPKGSKMDKGSVGERFSTHQLFNLELHSSSPNRIIRNKGGAHYKHSHFEKNSGILEPVMEPEVAPADIRGRRRMPDAQVSVRTMLSSDYPGHQDRSEGKEFPELSIENLEGPRLSSVEISSKPYRSKSVQKNKSLGDSVIRPSLSVRSGKLNPRKRHKRQHPNTHTKEKMFKRDSSNLNEKELWASGESPFPTQHYRETVRKHPQTTKSKADSSNSILKRDNSTENSATKGYACDQCGKRFKEKRQLTRHQGLHSEKKSIECKSKVECKVCSKGLSSNSDLERHMRVHSGEKPFQCQVCRKTFSRKCHLADHERIHSGEKPFSCEICNRGFSNIANMRRHRRMHTEEKPYMCEICMRRFSHNSKLRIHSRVHTGEKPYECEVCKQRFSDCSDLQRHSRVHTGEKPYECEICKKSFSRTDNLRTHSRVHTGEKPYECEVCKKTFVIKVTLTRHKRIHSGEKPFNCEVCNRGFSESSSLRVHRRTHTEEKPYMCEVCERRFSQISNLKRHRCIHQKEK